MDMDKTEITENETTSSWTTWEELLLACAVKRHGFKNWDTVSMEIQARSSLPHLFITPQNCKLKYLDLKRRFTARQNDVADDITVDTVPWLEELRELRVAELRQEVQRYDVSILSLQLKVKRLEEEREQSLKENGDGDEKPDLDTDAKDDRSENDKKELDGKTEKSSPEQVAGKAVSGEESDRENQSVNESNSTGPKGEIQEAGLENADREHEPVNTGSDKPLPVSGRSKSVGDDSYNESSDSIAKGLTHTVKSMKVDHHSSELRDSVSESKRVEEGTKESSDVQSSASLTTRSRRRIGVTGDTAGDEPNTEAASRAIKQIAAKSQPLIGMMELIRSHKHGSLFERRLKSQETDNYDSIVRQHMDLQTLQKLLDQGSYSTSSPSKFYRDLLLLFNNAIVFFPKSSVESTAAHELRSLIADEISKQTQRSNPSPEPSVSPPIQRQTKSDPEKPDSLLEKQKPSAPLIVCRKRSSISSKPAGSSAKQGDQQSEEKKPVVDVKPTTKSSSSLVQEQSLIKTNATTDRVVTGTRSLRRSNTNLRSSAGTTNKNQSNNSTASDKKEIPKADNKKEKEASASVKKRGAADFLKRIKGNSSMEKSKSSANDSSKSTRGNNGGNGGSGGGSGGEQKRKASEKKDGRRDRVLRHSGGKQAKEESSPSKRSVGRPPKRGAADSVPSKRGRETEVSASKRPKKRSRR